MSDYLPHESPPSQAAMEAACGLLHRIDLARNSLGSPNELVIVGIARFLDDFAPRGTIAGALPPVGSRIRIVQPTVCCSHKVGEIMEVGEHLNDSIEPLSFMVKPEPGKHGRCIIRRGEWVPA